MQIQAVANELAQWAPPPLAESYDNVGLLVGDPSQAVSGVLVSLEVTDAVLDEAIEQGCNLIVSHHPLWFGSKTRLASQDWVSRLLQRAIQHHIALYALHTNLDNVAHGVNAKLAEKIGLIDTRILQPQPDMLVKLDAHVPQVQEQAVEDALDSVGVQDFAWVEPQDPVGIGSGPLAQLTARLPRFLQGRVERQLFHLSDNGDTIAYQFTPLNMPDRRMGSGQIGVLPEPMAKEHFLGLLKQQFGTPCLRYSDAKQSEVRRVALCGGAGSFLLKDALQAEADALVTSDISYHKFFDGEGRMMLIDIGHYESEQFTGELIIGYLRSKFSDLSLRLSGIVTNPVNYFA
jgi:dinuclear metal center YbgI/SA1388 family protein